MVERGEVVVKLVSWKIAQIVGRNKSLYREGGEGLSPTNVVRRGRDELALPY